MGIQHFGGVSLFFQVFVCDVRLQSITQPFMDGAIDKAVTLPEDANLFFQG